MTTTAAKTLEQMQAEVLEWARTAGWYDKPVSYAEAMCMLHSEVSEALEAWRRWEFADATDPDFRGVPAKPEGVGSELADVLIRWLDDCARFGIDLADAERWLPGPQDVDLIAPTFPAALNRLHDLISKASLASPDHMSLAVLRLRFGFMLAYLRRLCRAYGVDLEAEYERKMAFNRTRPYRHGNKPI